MHAPAPIHWGAYAHIVKAVTQLKTPRSTALPAAVVEQLSGCDCIWFAVSASMSICARARLWRKAQECEQTDQADRVLCQLGVQTRDRDDRQA